MTQSPFIPRGDEQHILFVDDENNMAQRGQRMLVGLGYRVTTAASTSEALDVIRNNSNKFDCLITDLSMPGMSGIDLARVCKHLLPAVPVILMNYGSAVTANFLRSYGIREMILKPFTPQAIAEALHRVLTNRQDVTHSDQTKN